MTLNLMLFELAVVSLSGGVTPLSLSANGLPANTSNYLVGYEEAAVCSDGAVWLTWSQIARDRLQSSGDHDLGLFCRLVSADGTNLIGPLRIAGAEYDRSASRAVTPSVFTVIPAVGGEAFIFYRYPPPRFSRTWDYPCATFVTAVSRSGEVSYGQFGGPMYGAHVQPGEKLSTNLWSFADSHDRTRVILLIDEVQYATLSMTGGKLRIEEPRGIFHAGEGAGDSVRWSRNRSPKEGWRRGLDWALCGWDYTGLLDLPGDTILVVGVPPIEGFRLGGWRNGQADGTIVVYRLRADDLMLLDSFRCEASRVKGFSFSGPRLNRAILQETESGFSLFVPTDSGTESYQLGPHGMPELGERKLAKAAAIESYSAEGGHQLLVFLGPYSDQPASVNWFGTSPSGLLYSSSLSR